VKPRTIRVLVITSVLGVFLAGLVVGYAAALYRAGSDATPPPPGRRSPPDPAGGVGERIARRLERFGSVLELADDQRVALTKILTDGERAMLAITAGVRPQLQAKRAELEAEISAVLTVEQRVRYRDLVPGGLARPPGRPPRDPDRPPR
jgi:hypothetical protein